MTFRFFLPLCAGAGIAVLSSCTGVGTAIGGLAEKSLSGSGTVAVQRVGIDPDTAAPVLKSTVISGDYASAPDGAYALQYRRRIAPSIFNSTAVSREVTINYIGTAERLEEAVDLVRGDLVRFEQEEAGPDAGSAESAPDSGSSGADPGEAASGLPR